jgi:threonine/homoserine/homoserine lactone efflux protein
MLSALASAVVLGLAAGLSPGPLMTLVLTQSLRHGAREGCKVALAPLLTDAPIILLALALASRVAELRPALGGLSIAGGVFVLYLAVEVLRAAPPELSGETAPPRSWAKGIAVNLLNPNPWLFWMTVGAASLARALSDGWLTAAAFLIPFYVLLVGSKLGLALLAGRSRHRLSGRPYRVILRVLAVLLVVFAGILFRDAWHIFFAAPTDSR